MKTIHIIVFMLKAKPNRLKLTTPHSNFDTQVAAKSNPVQKVYKKLIHNFYRKLGFHF